MQSVAMPIFSASSRSLHSGVLTNTVCWAAGTKKFRSPLIFPRVLDRRFVRHSQKFQPAPWHSCCFKAPIAQSDKNFTGEQLKQKGERR